MKDDIRSTRALRLGFRQISGSPKPTASHRKRAAAGASIPCAIFWLRTRLKPAALERLAEADRVSLARLDRRDALWACAPCSAAATRDDLPLFARVTMPELEPDADLPPMRPGEQVIEDYRHLHLSLRAHPVSFVPRRARPAQCPAPRASRRHSVGPARHRRRPRPGAAAPGQRPRVIS